MCNGIMFIRAQTSLHLGTGSSVGAVDQPIQRERCTGWPTGYGSSLKGALRDGYRVLLINDGKAADRQAADEHPRLTTIFGPPRAQGSDHQGALAITDARIMLYPVRSLKGLFAWVTCPAVIAQLGGALQLMGAGDTRPQVPDVAVEDALVHAGCSLVVPNQQQGQQGHLVLEDVALKARTGQSEHALLARWLRGALGIPEGAFDDPQQRLVIVNDDVFGYFVQHCTELTQRVALDYDTKTAAGGALFTQEFLPPETVLYSVLLVEDPLPRTANGSDGLTSQMVVKEVEAICQRPLQLGSNQTTGKGWCRLRVQTASAAAWPAQEVQS